MYMQHTFHDRKRIAFAGLVIILQKQECDAVSTVPTAEAGAESI